MYSPSATGGRGYALGEFWTENGDLVASTAQEGLIRCDAGVGKTTVREAMDAKTTTDTKIVSNDGRVVG